MALGRFFKHPRSEDATISFDSYGISIARPVDDPAELNFLRWDDIRQAVAYKKDCFSVDQIRLEFLSLADRSLLITEDDAGFNELIDSLPQYLAGMPTEWYARLVAAPAFDQAMQVIFERQR